MNQIADYSIDLKYKNYNIKKNLLDLEKKILLPDCDKAFFFRLVLCGLMTTLDNMLDKTTFALKENGFKIFFF